MKLLDYDHPALALPAMLSGAGDEAADFHLRREVADLPVVARFTIDGEPVSKARARFTKYRSKTQAYTPEKTTQAEQVVAWKFRAAARSHVVDGRTAFGVMAVFFSATLQRRDVDNMLKLVLDGLNGVAWTDDYQVAEISGRKSYVGDNPDHARTEVVVYRFGEVPRRTVTCQQCGAAVDTYDCLSGRRKYCSNECARAARRAARKPQSCAGCGAEFMPPTPRIAYCSPECRKGRVTVECSGCGTSFSKQACHVRARNYCSTKCRDAANRDRRQALAKGTCEICGGPTSKKSYKRCQACRDAGTAVPGHPKVLQKAGGLVAVTEEVSP